MLRILFVRLLCRLEVALALAELFLAVGPCGTDPRGKPISLRGGEASPISVLMASPIKPSILVRLPPDAVSAASPCSRRKRRRSISAVGTSASRNKRFSSRSRLSARTRKADISASRCARSCAYCRINFTAPVFAISLLMWSSFDRCNEPGTSNDDLGESSNKAPPLPTAADALVRRARVAFLSRTFCDVDLVTAGFAGKSCAPVDGSASGSREGNEVSEGSSSS
jgi:hypothetical protein